MHEVLGRHIKGLPHGTDEMRLADITGRGWKLLAEDLPLPVAVLSQSALANNSQWMRRFVSQTGVKFAPHGKTSMSPELFKLQLEDGAWAITLATVHQFRVAREAGVRRIILANEMVGPCDIGFVLDQLAADSGFEFFCLVDSKEGVRRLAEMARRKSIGGPLNVLLEAGYRGGRAGCRDLGAALAVAADIKECEPYLALCGIAGYEGLNQGNDAETNVGQFLQQMVLIAEHCDDSQLFGTDKVILSAGGSAYYDIVVETLRQTRLRRECQVVLRGGCYFFHDAGLYRRFFSQLRARSAEARRVGGGFQNALEVWAYVISIPESGRVILGAGRRDLGHDAGPPEPLKKFRPGRDHAPEAVTADWRIVSVNDQHAHMTVPAEADVGIGDMIALGVSHPCTTFDKWQLVYIVDDGYQVLSAIRTYF